MRMPRIILAVIALGLVFVLPAVAAEDAAAIKKFGQVQNLL